MVSRKFRCVEILCALIYGEFAYISCKYIFTFYDLGINVLILLYFWIFVDLERRVNFKEKQNSKTIQRVKIILSLKANNRSLTISSNLNT